MSGYLSRRRLMMLLGFGGAAAGSSIALSGQRSGTRQRAVEDLQDAIAEMPVIDVHSHGFPAFAPVTEETFLEVLSLSAWMLNAYFPPEGDERLSVYAKWQRASPEERRKLDQVYGIQRHFDDVIGQMRSTLFVEALIKELASFFGCRATLSHIVAARNEYTSGNYWRYVNDLFASVKLEGALVQGSLGAWTVPAPDQGDFKRSVDMTVYDVATAAAYMDQSLPFDTLVSNYRESLIRQAKVDGAVAFKSGIVKVSGADVKPVTASEAEQGWERYRALSPEDQRRVLRRIWRPDFAKKVQDYILWETCDLAYELDVPLHIHAGNGEGQDMISSHYPYKLENVVRYPVEFPQKPVQVVMLHAGYPHHGEAAYMAHIFPNVWFDMSIMAPFVNRGLHQRFLEVFEIAPLNKVMYGSDAYHVPEFFYLGAKWAKKYAGSALATLVDEGILTLDDAVNYAKMILADNARRLHKIDNRG